MKKSKTVEVENMKIPQSISKKFILLISLCIIIALSLVTTLILIINKSKNEEYVTRAEWITMLGENFGLTTFEQQNPYYVDVPSSHSAYTYVQASYEWDILREQKKFVPDKAATRGFVAQTAVLAATPVYDSSYADMDDDELFLFAFEKGIISSDVSKDYVTEEECAKIIENIKQYYLSLVPEEYANIKLKDAVIDYSSSQNIRIDEDTVYFSENTGKELEVGSIFIAPGYPYGVAKKVTSLNQVDGQIVVTTEEPEIEDVFEELDFCFVGRASYEDIVPLQEGVTISPLSETDSSNSMSNTSGIMNLSSTSLKRTEIPIKSISAKVNITKGKLMPNIAFTDYFSVEIEETYSKFFGCDIPKENGELLKNTHTVMKYDQKGNLVLDKTEEWKSGYEITGEVKVKDMYIEFSYEDNLKSFSSKVHFEVDSSLKVVGKLEGSVPIYEAVIPGPWGVWVKVVFSVYVDFNGEISVGAEIEHTTNVSYKNKNFKTTQDTDYQSSVSKRSADISSGIKGELIPTVLGIELIDVTAKAGAGIEMGTTVHHSKQASMICIDGTMYFPKVSISVGINSKTLANKLGIKATFKLVDKSGAIIKSAQRTLWHCEITGKGFANVKQCTWGTVIAQPETESKSESIEAQNSVKTEVTTTPHTPNQTEVETTSTRPNQTEAETTSTRPNQTEAETTPCIDVNNLPASQGLEFALNRDGNSYSAAGIGTCTDTIIVIPHTHEGKLVTRIKRDAFKWCEGLTNIIIPDSVTIIESGAFSRCSNLTSICIPDSVTKIESGAFSRCSNLTSICIPDSITKIENFAFDRCENLEAVYITDIAAWCKIQFERDNLYRRSSNPLYYAGNLYLNNKLVTELVIPNSVTKIGRDAFVNCSKITNVVIPNSVTSIGDRAFEDCSGLINVSIPDSVSTINYCAFAGCTSLASIELPNSITKIETLAFSNCSSLKTVVIPDSVTYIGIKAFEHCESLISVTIPNSITEIGEDVFSDCRTLNNVYIPEGITSLPSGMFSRCSALTNIYLPETITELGSSVFSSCTNLTTINLPNGITELGLCAFGGCTSLTSITIPDSVTSIGTSAFQCCTSLTSITIPDSVTSIGAWAFYECTSLKSVFIPISVISIDIDAFDNCELLQDVYYEGSKAQWENIEIIKHLQTSFFEQCFKKAEIHFNS